MNPVRAFTRSFLLGSLALGLMGTGGQAAGWEQGQHMPAGRAYAAGAALGNDLYVVGGATTAGPVSATEIYDMKEDLWRAAPALPVGLQQFGLVSLSGRLYAAGGFAAAGRNGEGGGPSAALYVFDPAVGVWMDASPMPQARVGVRLAAIGERIYALGGRGESAAGVYVYDPSSDEWSKASSPMPAPRSGAAVIAMGGLIYVIGGQNGGVPTARVDIYDPAKGAWRAGPALPAARSGLAVALADGAIHVAGGEDIKAQKTFADHYVLDPAAGAWRKLAPLPTPRHDAVAGAGAGRFYVIGGGAGAGVYAVFTASDQVEYSSTK
ncbi:MAG: kelch repeat-containing protein [Parvibaculaceae bacterium]|nr:kelch repeat-containing protein [Parvibaculaceae bacterium]